MKKEIFHTKASSIPSSEVEGIVKEPTKELAKAYRELGAKKRELEELVEKVVHLEAIKRGMEKYVPRVVKDALEKNADI